MDTPVIHKREAWIGSMRWMSSPYLTWSSVTTHAIHYPGVKDVPDGDYRGIDYEMEAKLADFDYHIPQFLRNAQSGYLNKTNPFNIGYNWAVDWLGGIWELRGWSFKCAANITANDFTFATQIMVDDQNEATELAVMSVRWLHLEAERLAGRRLAQLPHNRLPDKDSPTGLVRTTCAGAGIIGQWSKGVFDPRDTNFPPKPPVDNHNTGDEMAGYIGYVKGRPGRVVVTDAGWRYIRSINGDGGTREVAYLETMGLAKRRPNGHDYEFPNNLPETLPRINVTG